MKDLCRDTLNFLDDYLDGGLSAAERATFETHLGRCPYCRDYLSTYQETIYLSRGQAQLEEDIGAPPQDLVDAIMSAVQGKPGDES
ncbi:anti-sigma factor family protein [Haliangium sp.]|uniref:anti-sigma factor family protein n=1 Tax=Haliangium sp. TaxID=2663208 RepID=UPI003D096A77